MKTKKVNMYTYITYRYTQWVLTPGFHIGKFWLITQDLVLEFIPHARQPATVYSLIQKPRTTKRIQNW